MKILLGYGHHPGTTAEFFEVFWRKEHDVVTFGTGLEHHDISCPIDVEMEEILHRVGERPDVFIYFEGSPFFPRGIEKIPFPCIFVDSDWLIGFEMHCSIHRFFDLVIMFCHDGFQAFQSLREGSEQSSKIVYFPFGYYNPRLHRKMDVEKIYDVSFVGSLNPVIQRDRNKKLEKLIALRKKGIRVFVAQNMWVEEYVRVINQSKIVFSDSLGDNTHMRVFEALGCGSFLLTNRTSDMHTFFEDGKHLVTYQDDDFEGTIDYYLCHEDEREQIAREGHLAVQAYTYENSARRVIATIEGRLQELREHKVRLNHFSSDYQFNSDYARVLTYQGYRGEYGLAIRDYEDALKGRDDNETLNDLGVLYGLKNNSDKAEECFLKALEKNSGYVLAKFNLGWIKSKSGGTVPALDLFESLLKDLEESNDKNYPLGLRYPIWDDYKLRWERLLIDVAIRKPQAHQAVRSFLTEVVLEEISKIHIQQEEYDPAINRLHEAVALNPQNSNLYMHLGTIAFSKGDYSLSADYFKKSAECQPFNARGEYNLATALLKGGRIEEAERVYLDSLEYNPLYHQYRPEALKHLGLIFWNKGSIGKAKSCFDEALRSGASKNEILHLIYEMEKRQ